MFVKDNIRVKSVPYFLRLSKQKLKKFEANKNLRIALNFRKKYCNIASRKNVLQEYIYVY